MDYSKILSTWWSGNCYHLEQLNAIITSQDVREYAYILHDKDKQENSDELKKPHYHFLIRFQHNQRGAWFKAFATDDMGLVFYERCTIPKSAYDYLIHDTPACRKAGKYLYDASERIGTIENLDPAEKEDDESAALFNDIAALIRKELTWHEMLKTKPKRIYSIANIRAAHNLLRDEAYGILDDDFEERVRQARLRALNPNR